MPAASPHLAVLIGPRASALRALLLSATPQVRCRPLPDVFALAEDSAIDEADSIWIDAAELDESSLGAHLFASRLRPEPKRILLHDEAPNGKEAPGGEAENVPFAAEHLRGAPDLATIRRVLALEDEGSEQDESVYAGIADQLANPLAALAARLQLCEIALQSRASVDFEDNLALARETTERMTKNLEKLRMMTARGPGTRDAHGIYELLARLRGSGALGEHAEAISLPEGDEDLAVWVDLGFFEQALTGVLRTSLDVSSGGVTAHAHARGDHVLIELRLEAPRALPRDCPDLFAPFAPLPLLRDPDLGLDLALARALLRSCRGSIRALQHSGFLEGFELELPRAPE